MTDEKQASDQAKSGSGSQSPMAMGMGMAKKMMGQMHEAGKPPPMERMMGLCMGMCSEMLNAIRQTNALAVHGTPELQNAFGEWLEQLEGKTEALVAAARSRSPLGQRADGADHVAGVVAEEAA